MYDVASSTTDNEGWRGPRAQKSRLVGDGGIKVCKVWSVWLVGW